MRSLRLRLLAWTSLLLAASFALLGAVIDSGFEAALEQAQRDLLDSQIITLLAVSEPGEGESLALPYDMPEVRLNAPGSGLYASIRDDTGATQWQSASAVGLDIEPATPLPEAGQRLVTVQETSTGERLQAMTLGIVWQFDDTRSRYFALTVAESRASIEAQLKSFRGQLYMAFAAIAVVLLIAMAALLSWLLRPLGQIAREIRAVEAGERGSLSADYPSELTGVARNLNRLVDSETRRTTRYQQTLSNLAHSLKTPLAAAQSLLGERGDNEGSVAEQLTRMQDIVRYQLARPAAAGGQLTGRGAVAILPELHALLDGLDKVYREKGVSAELDVSEGLSFEGDRGDLVEIVGNLLDNAYKWCERRVLLEARGEQAVLTIRIEDDGPGIDDVAGALERGTRLDETTPGTGIGLAVANELVAVYEGELHIDRGPLGGARLTLKLPGGISSSD
ncbi:MAG: ATP-binding protein [Pseudomonadota bacterium]